MMSDLIIIPVTPSPLDFSAAGSVVTVLEAQVYNRPVEARFLITRKIEQATMLSVLKGSIAQTGAKAFKTVITQRQSYVRSVVESESVFVRHSGQHTFSIARSIQFIVHALLSNSRFILQLGAIPLPAKAIL